MTTDPNIAANIAEIKAAFIDGPNNVAIATYTGQMADYKRNMDEHPQASYAKPVPPKIFANFREADYTAAFWAGMTGFVAAAVRGEQTELRLPDFHNFVDTVDYVPPDDIQPPPPVKGQAALGASMGGGFYAEQPGDTSPDGTLFPPAPLPALYVKHVRESPFGGRVAWWQGI